MEKTKYDKLKKISIEKSGIIKNSISDPIYKFCVLNRIDNLGDFIEFYNIERINMDRRYSFNYFDGIIDLINLAFFNEKLPKVSLLNKKIKIFKSDSPKTLFAYVENDIATVGRTENKTLKRLGFNNEEAKAILRHVIYLDREVRIITVIKSYLENFNFKKMNKDDEMFVTKLYALSQYYDKTKNDIQKESEYIDKVKEDILELKKLYNKLYKIQNKINEVTNDFLRNIDMLPTNDETVKKLIKEYQKFDCK